MSDKAAPWNDGTWRIVADASGVATVERADVKVGSRRDGMAEIAQGLKVGERIVVDGTGKLRVGARIVDARGDQPPAGDVGAAPKAG